VAILLAIAPGAQAQTDPNKLEAKSHYEKATRLYDVGKYGESIQEYEAAYLLVEDPALLYNIGQAYRLWDRPEEAVRAYKNYLRKRPDASNRGDVEKRISELERIIEERRRASAPAPVVTAPVTVPPVAPEPPPAATVAPVTPLASSPAAPAPIVTPATAPANEPAIGAAVPPPATAGSRGRTVSYAFMGAGGASLLTSLVAGLYAHSQSQKIVDASNNKETYNPDWQSRGRAANTLAIVTGVSGLVLAGTGLYLFWTSTPNDHRASAGTRRTALYPVAGPGFAGAAASVDF
jgi:tetratricopeptide (TPR) repeat protein